MDSAAAAELAGPVHRRLDLLHSMTYFPPEAQEQLTGIGLQPGQMTYFAVRSAPLGAVGPAVVAATFFNFSPELVARHIPAAWQLATPEQVLDARWRAVDAVFRTRLGAEAVDSGEMIEAAELAREAAAACTAEGRPLFAAHAALAWPEEPHLVFWHAITLLREYRGDGHIAALVGHELDGIAALVTHTATGKGFTLPAAQATRGWSAEQWDAAVQRLRERGILDATGALTEAGAELRASLEAATDRSAAAPWRHLGADRSVRLGEIGRAFTEQIVANGAFPAGVFEPGRFAAATG